MSKKKKSSDAPPGIGLLPMNLIVGTAKIEPAATLMPGTPYIGGPIMREGFITGTGLLPSSTQSWNISPQTRTTD